MITYKVFLDVRRPKAGGKYPLMFRITYNRSTSNYASGISVLKEHWNADANLLNSSCPNYKELNKNLTTKFLTIQKILLQMEDEGSFSFEAFKQRFHEKPAEKKPTLTFNAYAAQIISELIEVKRTGNAVVYQTAVNRVTGFAGNKSLTFEQIDYVFLDKFKHQLIKDGAKPNTIGNYLRSVRAIYNKAIKAKLVSRDAYPFTDMSIRTEKTAKRAIKVDEVKKIVALNLKHNSPEWYARAYFLLSFSLIGISFTDMAYIKHTDISKGRLLYQRRKTHKAYNIKLTAFTAALLETIGHNGKYLLPVIPKGIEEDTLNSKKVIQQWVKTTNKYLKRIGKQCGVDCLTTYVARHTWATTAKRLGYSIELIAEAMGHEHGNKITNIYLDSFDQSLIDDVNAKVINCIQ